MSPLKLGLTSLVGVGSIAGGIGVYKLYDSPKVDKLVLSKTIADRLKDEKFSVLGNGPENVQHWNNIKAAYNSAKSDSNKVFSSLEGELENICKEVLSKTESDSVYQKARRWCVAPVTIKEYLEKFNLRVLNASGATDRTSWTNKVTEYEKQENSDKRMSDLGTLNESSKWEQLRNKCGTISGKKSYEEGFMDFFEKYKEWCSVKK